MEKHVLNKGLPGVRCSRRYLMVSMFQSVLQFQFVLATSARKMLIYTSRRALSIDSCDDGVHAKQNLGGIKNLQDYYHDRKKKVSLGRTIWFPKRRFRAKKEPYRNQFQEMVEGECNSHRTIWFPKQHFLAKNEPYGNQISTGIVDAHPGPVFQEIRVNRCCARQTSSIPHIIEKVIEEKHVCVYVCIYIYMASALALSCASQAKCTTSLQQHNPIIRVYKTHLRGFWSSLIYIYICMYIYIHTHIYSMYIGRVHILHSFPEYVSWCQPKHFFTARHSARDGPTGPSLFPISGWCCAANALKTSPYISIYHIIYPHSVSMIGKKLVRMKQQQAQESIGINRNNLRNR